AGVDKEAGRLAADKEGRALRVRHGAGERDRGEVAGAAAALGPVGKSVALAKQIGARLNAAQIPGDAADAKAADPNRRVGPRYQKRPRERAGQRRRARPGRRLRQLVEAALEQLLVGAQIG